jgi:hypothetical protein
MRKIIPAMLVLVMMAVCLYAGGTLRLTSAEAGLQWVITLDSREYQFYQGIEIPLDEGVHRFQAEAEGYALIDRPVTIRDGERTEIELGAEDAGIVSRIPTLRETAQVITGTLTVLGTSSAVPFDLSESEYSTPAEFRVAAGNYELTFADVTQRIEVKEHAHTFIQLDSSTRKMRKFTVSQVQAAQLEARSSSLEQLFKQGYRTYGPKWYASWQAIAVICALILLFVAIVLLRFSVGGRVSAVLRRQKRLEKKKRVELNPKENVLLEKRIRKNKRQTSNLVEYLEGRIKLLKSQASKYADERTQDRHEALKLQKRYKKIKRRLRKVLKLRSRLESVS